jgi:hypothetical protein
VASEPASAMSTAWKRAGDDAPGLDTAVCNPQSMTLNAVRHTVRNDSQACRIISVQRIRWARVRYDMKITILLSKMARSLLVASMVSGMTGAAYAQIGPGGVIEGGSAGMGVGMGNIPREAGPANDAAAGYPRGEMSGMSKALPGLGKDSSMPERGVPGLGSTAEPRVRAFPGPDIPPGKQSTSRASSRMKPSDWIGGESPGMGVGSSQE